MKTLVAEDDRVSRRLVEALLAKWGYEVIVTCDGLAAWEALLREDGPRLALIDWMMPGIDGMEICKRVRETPATQSAYIILLTAKSHKSEMVAGLDAGADDYIIKPFDLSELRARVQVGARVVELQTSLNRHVHELKAALSQVKQLQGILPICSHCKKVRDDSNYWQQVELYISAHSEAQFSHSICPDCYNALLKAAPRVS